MKGRGPSVLSPVTLGTAFVLAALVMALLVLLPVANAPVRASSARDPSALDPNGPLAATTISSDIATDTTWERVKSPYLVTADVTVGASATLTVEQGVEVRFEQFAGLSVVGKLVAAGTSGQPITFTGTTGQPGWWDGISLVGSPENPASATFSYVTIEFGAAWGNLYVQDGLANVSHSIIRNSSADGIYGWYGGVAHVSASTFTNNLGYAINFIDGSVNPVLYSLSATGNGFDAVALGAGALSGTHTWESAGLPYVIVSTVDVAGGASLTIQPGVEVRFQQNAGLAVEGRLVAAGSPTEPITFTGTKKQAGWWRGLSIAGSPDDPAAASLSYVIIEYGADWGNLYVQDGQASVSHSIIRNSSADGIYAWYGGAGTTIASSQIISNAGFGVRNVDSGLTLMAANNWWGSNNGPQLLENTSCNPGGSGSTVSGGVAFSPFLTDPGASPDPLSPSEARILSLAPQRWFVPADGVIRAWVTVGLKDGNGQPLPGRAVRLRSTLGDVVDGALTDVRGQTLAYLTSGSPGEAELTAVLDSQLSCEAARSASARITFTPASGGTALLPDEAAPYLNDGLEIDPEPITQGVPTALRARFQNPNDFPITVNATFGIAQLGLGLVFGPVGEVEGAIIPAGGESVVQVTWSPPASGHYCLQVQYSYRTASGVSLAQNQGTGSSQRNVDVAPGSRSRATEYDEVRKARTAIHAIEGGHYAVEIGAALLEGEFPAMPFAVPSAGVGKIIEFNLETWSKASAALAGAEDPPRQDYDILATPPIFSYTRLQPGTGLSPARAEAANRLVDALLDQTSKLKAALVSMDRYDGAAQAGDAYWTAQQGAALDYYKKQSGLAMAVSAGRLDAYVQALRSDGYSRLTVTADAISSYQQQLRSQGFNATEIQAARVISMTDQEIEAMRQRRLSAVPSEVAGDQMASMTALASALRGVGLAFSSNPLVGTSSEGRASQAISNNLTLIYATSYSFQVGNPLTQTAKISLTVRRLDMPSDWMVTVMPITVTLAPQAITTATVTVEPGSAAVQGTLPRVAIEGYAGRRFLGGVALDILVPQRLAFDGKLRVYLPALLRSFSGAW